MNSNSEKQINCLLVGELNVGKSTFINAIYSDVLSEAKPVRTTMGINIYKETSDTKSISNSSEILLKNTNNDIKMQNSQELVENTHNIKISTDFGSELKKKGFTMNWIDTPGLADPKLDPQVYKWMENNMEHIDVVFMITNVHSGGIANNITKELANYLFSWKQQNSSLEVITVITPIP